MSDQTATPETETKVTPLTKRDLTEGNIDKIFAGHDKTAEVSRGELVIYRTPEQRIEDAKMMSASRALIPQWLRANPGDCWAILVMSEEMRISPIALARMSFAAPGGAIDFMSQLYHALIEMRAPLVRRLRPRYAGEGDTRTCTVVGWLKGDPEPFEYTTPPLKQIIDNLPNKRDGGGKGGSPLWFKDADQQLWYFAVRAWGRKYVPEVLMTLPDNRDSEDTSTPEQARDVTEMLSQRLAEAAAQNGTRPVEGFSEHGHQDALGEAQDDGGSPPKAKGRKRTSGHAKPPKRQSKRKEAGSDSPTEPSRAVTPALPSTPEQYAAWVDAWLGSAIDAGQIEQRWGAERKLRNACGLIEEQRVAIRNVVEERIKELTP